MSCALAYIYLSSTLYQMVAYKRAACGMRAHHLIELLGDMLYLTINLLFAYYFLQELAAYRLEQELNELIIIRDVILVWSVILIFCEYAIHHVTIYRPLRDIYICTIPSLLLYDCETCPCYVEMFWLDTRHIRKALAKRA